MLAAAGQADAPGSNRRARPLRSLCGSPAQTSLIDRGEATSRQLAYLTDRVRVNEGKDQVYGTQLASVLPSQP